MRLHNILMATHLLAGAIGAAAISVVNATSPTTPILAGIGGAAGVLALVLGFYVSSRLSAALTTLDRTLATGDSTQIQSAGIVEFDRIGERMRSLVQRWSDAAVNSREQARDIDLMIQRLNRRGSGAARSRTRGSSLALRQQLSSIAMVAAQELNRMLACTKELERHVRDIATGAEDQSEAVSKTTTYVEQMSANIDSVAKNARAAQQAAVTTRDSASEALKLVRALIDGMNRIRTHVEASESRLRSLGDHSQEISSIVEMIGSISSRTDMLALNASIESVRAGEHGRGFAVVAEEVRKLAEQAAEATREVAGLVESIQLETQESISLMAEERAEVEAEVARVNAAGDALERISRISSDSAAQVGEITQATQLQLQLTQDVVLAVERITNVARTSRTRAEEACWTTNTLTKLGQQFDASLRPLRDCGPNENELPLEDLGDQGTLDNDSPELVDALPTA
jgi:methyl-accepting chemotaxis protein